MYYFLFIFLQTIIFGAPSDTWCPTHSAYSAYRERKAWCRPFSAATPKCCQAPLPFCLVSCAPNQTKRSVIHQTKQGPSLYRDSSDISVWGSDLLVYCFCCYSFSYSRIIQWFFWDDGLRYVSLRYFLLHWCAKPTQKKGFVSSSAGCAGWLAFRPHLLLAAVLGSLLLLMLCCWNAALMYSGALL